MSSPSKNCGSFPRKSCIHFLEYSGNPIFTPPWGKTAVEVCGLLSCAQSTGVPLKTVGSYWPYAIMLFNHVHGAMPFQAPEYPSNNHEWYAVVGYILSQNKLLASDATVDAETLMAMKIPNRDDFIVDDKPDVSVATCYHNCLKKTTSATKP